MYFWYKLITYLFYPLAPIYLYIRKIKKKEDPDRYGEKFSIIKKSRQEGFLIWFHVASVGEAMSILPLIDSCIQEKKIKQILITSITLSSGKILKKKFKEGSKVVHQFLPLDINILVKKFLDHWKPNLSIFIDSEIWPNLIFGTHLKKIPLLLVNARITNKTFNRWRLAKNFAKNVFGKFELCVASNLESENFLKILGAKNIKNYGNLKFSNIKTDKNSTLDLVFLNKIKNRKIWCAASTHLNEEVLCGTAHLKIKKIHSDVLTIIIPRHVNRVKKISDELLKLNLKVILSSSIEKISDNTDIILIDAYGETLKFFDVSKYVFVGKSLVELLKNDSGQNPIEAARLGCKIYHGPNVTNFKEIYDHFNTLGITKKVNNLEELSLSLIGEFNDDKPKNYQAVSKIENYGHNIFNNINAELKKYI
jgi:3-deoxy-D-manno-octulosonic-acid transferase